MFGGLVFAFYFNSGMFQVAGATVEASVSPSRVGVTTLKIPPLGEIKAQTHRLPVGLSVSLEKVTFDQFRRLTRTSASQSGLMRDARSDLTALVRDIIVRILALGVGGGFLAGLLLPGRNRVRIAVGALSGALAAGGLIAAVSADYNFRAWRQPRYSGMLAAAPWLVDTVEEKLNDFDLFRDEMGRVADNVYAFYSRVQKWEPVDLGKDELKVLHVGDIHNNPVAFTIIKQIVDDFDVDFIIDTGDLTDFGTPVETNLAEKAGALGVPYVFVPGNHESPPVLETLRQYPSVRVVDDQIVRVMGLRILGLTEPASTDFSAVSTSDSRLAALSRQAARRFMPSSRKPDILAVHSVKQGEAFIGRVPVTLSGHTHRPSLEVLQNTVLLDVGTSGAAGLRTFQVEDGLPYTFNLLHFDRGSRDLLAVDSLTLSGLSREFVLERRLINDSKDRLPK